MVRHPVGRFILQSRPAGSKGCALACHTFQCEYLKQPHAFHDGALSFAFRPLLRNAVSRQLLTNRQYIRNSCIRKHTK